MKNKHTKRENYRHRGITIWTSRTMEICCDFLLKTAFTHKPWITRVDSSLQHTRKKPPDQQTYLLIGQSSLIFALITLAATICLPPIWV